MKLISLLSACLLGACFLLPAHALADNGKTAYPAPIQALKANGITIRGTMPAPAGFKGFVGEYKGEPMPVYLLPDGKHTVAGNLFDANGKDLTGDAFAKSASPNLDKAWTQLGKADWLREGSSKAKRMVYVFTDTECPYCHKLWHAIRPQVESGQVQVRYLLVAVIKRESLPRAASILESSDPLAAFTRNETDFRHSPIKLARTIPDAIKARIGANIALMDQIGITGTPGIVFKDHDGHVQKLSGLPPAEGIRYIFGN